VELPPLRDRPDDIPLLARHFLAAAAATCGRDAPALDDAFLEALAGYDWPGNVRELRNVLERAVALSGPDTPFAAHAIGLPATPAAVGAEPAPIDPATPFHDAKNRLIDAWERQYLIALLGACAGNVSVAARRGGLHRAHLHRLLKKHRLD